MPTAPVVWVLLRLCMNSALSYDMQIVPSHILAPCSAPVDAAVHSVVCACLQEPELSAVVQEQLGRGVEQGVVSLPSSRRRSDMASVAACFRFVRSALHGV